MPTYPQILHHGARTGVTGSCHELQLAADCGVLIDCGLFQGAEESEGGAGEGRLELDFPIAQLKALVVSHVHIDHVGRIPYLLAAGFRGPIYLSEPSALLLPLVLEDAVKVGISRDERLIGEVLRRLRRQMVALSYGRWQSVAGCEAHGLRLRLQPAGHILGSAYVEFQCGAAGPRVVFSGDLGAPYAPLLPAPKAPFAADVVVLESTYGDRLHEGRRERKQRLQQVLEHALNNRGAVLVPAFSIGRTQELLYELEEIIFRNKTRKAAPELAWEELEVIVDSPLAARFTKVYRQLRPFWDAEARQRLGAGRHPLDFEQLTTIDSHAEHLETVRKIQRSGRPCVVLAAGGMCSGGRIVNYLKALLGDPRTDLLFVGYQAAGTPGRAIQEYGPRGGYVLLDGEKYPIRAAVHTIGGYSAHADQKDLLNFIRRMRRRPKLVRLVHGDAAAKAALKQQLETLGVEQVIL